MKITKIMTDDVITAEPIQDLTTVANLMKKNNISFVPIVFNKQLLGVVTDRDIAIKGYGNKRDSGTKITEIMSNNFVTVHNDTSVEEVAKLMERYNTKNICITDNGHLCGVCTLGDLAQKKDFRDEIAKVLNTTSQK